MNIFRCGSSSIRRLSHISRFSSLPINRSENVAEHTFYCALFAHMIAKDMVADGYTEVRPELAMEKALYHDFEEALTGDIIRSFKYSTEDLKAEIKAAGEIRMKELVHEFGEAADYIYNVWDEAKDESLEGRIVTFSDLICVVFYCREEVLSGNKHLMPVVHEVYNWMRPYADDDLFGKYYRQIYVQDEHSDILRETGIKVPA